MMQQAAIKTIVRCLAGDDAGNGGANVRLKRFCVGIQLLPLADGFQLFLCSTDLRFAAGFGPLEIRFAERLVKEAVEDRVTAALQFLQFQLQTPYFLLPIISAVG